MFSGYKLVWMHPWAATTWLKAKANEKCLKIQCHKLPLDVGFKKNSKCAFIDVYYCHAMKLDMNFYVWWSACPSTWCLGLFLCAGHHYSAVWFKVDLISTLMECVLSSSDPYQPIALNHWLYYIYSMLSAPMVWLITALYRCPRPNCAELKTPSFLKSWSEPFTVPPC